MGESKKTLWYTNVITVGRIICSLLAFYELLNYSHSSDIIKNKSVLFIRPRVKFNVTCHHAKVTLETTLLVKKYETTNSVSFNFNFVSLQMRAYAWPWKCQLIHATDL